MKVLGVDPGSYATGYGVVEQSGKTIRLCETGTVTPKRSDPIEQRLFKIHKALEQIIVEHRPSVLVLEKLYAHAKFPATAPVIGQVRGVVCLLAAQNELSFEEYSVKRIRVNLLGNGNATKEQTQWMVCKRLNISAENLTLDASDALALALGYLQMNAISALAENNNRI